MVRVLAVVLPLLASSTAFAHRLDQYLQATTIAVEKGLLMLQLHLTPGVAVAPQLLAEIDTDGNGVISGAEQLAYIDKVRHDLSLTVDGASLQLHVVSNSIPAIEEITNGVGEILIKFEADMPQGGLARHVTFENRHHKAMAAYLVNCLVPDDPDIRILSQHRNYDQSQYQLDFTTSALQISQATPASSGLRQWLEQTGNFAVLESYFVHGVHHILTGYDHILFISALVLAAATLWDLVKVVTAFTLAHTLTLTLAALNLVHLPGRVVEPLISASIVFVAVQNIFWPRQAKGWSRLAVAFFFGLFHGLGFAGGLLDAMHDMKGTTVTLALIGFSVGVEVGHQMVVLPLFAVFKASGHSPTSDAQRANLSTAIKRIASAMISVAGAYYLCLALRGAP